MDNKIEININEEVTFKFKCVKDSDSKSGCGICNLSGTVMCSMLLCGAMKRSDNKSVHFELINE